MIVINHIRSRLNRRARARRKIGKIRRREESAANLRYREKIRDTRAENKRLENDIEKLKLEIEATRKRETARADKTIAAAEKRLATQRGSIDRKLQEADLQRDSVIAMESALHGNIQNLCQKFLTISNSLDESISQSNNHTGNLQKLQRLLGQVTEGTVFEHRLELEGSTDEAEIRTIEVGNRKPKNTRPNKRT